MIRSAQHITSSIALDTKDFNKVKEVVSQIHQLQENTNHLHIQRLFTSIISFSHREFNNLCTHYSESISRFISFLPHKNKATFIEKASKIGLNISHCWRIYGQQPRKDTLTPQRTITSNEWIQLTQNIFLQQGSIIYCLTQKNKRQIAKYIIDFPLNHFEKLVDTLYAIFVSHKKVSHKLFDVTKALLSSKEDEHAILERLSLIFAGFFKHDRKGSFLDFFNELSLSQKFLVCESLLQVGQNYSNRKDMRQWLSRLLSQQEAQEFVKKAFHRKSPFLFHWIVFSPNCSFLRFMSIKENNESTHWLNSFWLSIDAAKILKELSKDSYFNNHFNKIIIDASNPNIPIDNQGLILLEELWSQVFILIAQKIEDPLAENYFPLIQKVPPIVIGFWNSCSDKKEVLKLLSPILNDAQLAWYIATLTPEEYNCMLDYGKTYFDKNRTIKLLRMGSKEQLFFFIEQKTNQANDLRKKISTQRSCLTSTMRYIKSNPCEESHETLNKQIVTLQILSKHHLSCNFLALEKFLENYLKKERLSCGDQPQKFQSILKSIKQSFPTTQKYIEEASQLIEQNTFRQSDWNEIDLTETLNDGFWALMRNKELPYLGIGEKNLLKIEHVGLLTHFGILGIVDIDYLGFSIESGRAFSKFLSCMMDFCKQCPDSQQSLKTFWETSLSLQTHKSNDENYSPIILQCINSQKNFEQINRFIQEFCNLFAPFDAYLTPSDKKFIEICSTQCSQLTEIERNHHLNMLFLIARNQHPLFCLHRYLTENSSLANTWTLLRSKGYFSIQELFDHKLCSSPSDLFQLSKRFEAISIPVNPNPVYQL